MCQALTPHPHQGDTRAMTQTPEVPEQYRQPTAWLTDPQGRHIATYHGADGETPTEEAWTVSLIATLPAMYYGDTDDAEPVRCPQCDREVTNDERVARPSDGQGDFICLPCLFDWVLAVVSLTPEQAAAMSWWDGEQPTPAQLGLSVPRFEG